MTHTNSPEATLTSIASDSKTTYVQVFDSSNQNWSPQPEYVMLFLKSQENYLNDLLRARGHVFLNDVHEVLGFKRTPAGQVVGWIKDGGVGFISFGLPRVPVDKLDVALMSVKLEFNPDGVIYNLI